MPIKRHAAGSRKGGQFKANPLPDQAKSEHDFSLDDTAVDDSSTPGRQIIYRYDVSFPDRLTTSYEQRVRGPENRALDQLCDKSEQHAVRDFIAKECTQTQDPKDRARMKATAMAKMFDEMSKAHRSFSKEMLDAADTHGGHLADNRRTLSEEVDAGNMSTSQTAGYLQELIEHHWDSEFADDVTQINAGISDPHDAVDAGDLAIEATWLHYLDKLQETKDMDQIDVALKGLLPAWKLGEHHEAHEHFNGIWQGLRNA